MLIAVLIIPQTRFPIQIFVNKTLAFSPDPIDDEQQLKNFQWPLQSLSGAPANLQDAKGNVIFINFWATWCAPCVAEMPSMQALYEDYGNKIDFYFITNDTSGKVAAFLKKNNYHMPVYFPLKRAPEMLSTETLPTSYLIDQNGKIIIKEFGVADWNSRDFRNLLDQLLVKN